MSIDYAKLNETARGRVFKILLDCKWHHYEELKEVGGVRYSARLLELKRLGYEIEDRPLEPQGKQYRLVSPDPSVPQAKHVKVFLAESDVEKLLGRGVLTKAARHALTDALGSFQHNRSKL